MKALKELLEETEHLNIAIQKSNYYTEEEAHEEIISIVKDWLLQNWKEELAKHTSKNRLLRLAQDQTTVFDFAALLDGLDSYGKKVEPKEKQE